LIRRRFSRSSRRSSVGIEGLLGKIPTLTLGAACNGTIVNDTEMGEVIQLQGDQRKDVQEFLVDKKEGLELDAKTIKVG
jgi:translation initiation factor SUI1